MALFEGREFLLALKERGSLVAGGKPFCRIVLKRGDGCVYVKLNGAVAKDAAYSVGCAQGDDDLGVLGDDDVVFAKIEALGKDLYEARVEGEWASLEDDRRVDVEPLRQAADSLLGDGMEGRQRQILFGDALVEEGLDIGFGIDAATARYVVDAGSRLGALVKLLYGDAQQMGYLVDKGACTARAAAVHAHVTYRGGAALLVGGQKDHLGVLAAQFYGGARCGVELADGDRVGHDLLDVACACGLRQRCCARSGYGTT